MEDLKSLFIMNIFLDNFTIPFYVHVFENVLILTYKDESVEPGAVRLPGGRLVSVVQLVYGLYQHTAGLTRHGQQALK